MIYVVVITFGVTIYYIYGCDYVWCHVLVLHLVLSTVQTFNSCTSRPDV